MHEPTTNILSMTPPASLKVGGSVGDRSTFSDDSRFSNSSSFSSKLSRAEDRQRSGLAESDRADDMRQSARTKAEAGPSESADEDTVNNSAKAKDSLPSDAKSGASSNDDATSAGVPDRRGDVTDESHGDGNQITNLRQDNSLVTAGSLTAGQMGDISLSGQLPNGNNVEGLTTNDVTNVNSFVEDTQVPTEDLPATVISTDLQGAGDLTLNSPESNTAASILTTDPLFSESALTGSLSPTALADAGVTAIDKRLGRLSSTIESLGAGQADTAVVPSETENSLKIDASVVSLRNKALGLDGEQILNPTIQQPGSKSEQSRGVLISDLTQSKEASSVLRDPQTAGGRTATPLEMTSAQIVAQLNQTAGRNASTINNSATGSSGTIALDQNLAASTGGTATTPPPARFDLANLQNVTASVTPPVPLDVPVLVSNALDQNLTATTGGINTAPIPGRIDLANPQNVTAPVPAPLNVPLLSSSASEVLSGNIRWMVGEGIQNATISVTPSGMGPITVQIGVEKDQMSISIVATQSSTREALEAAIPRLREQLGTQGLESVRVDVSDGRSDQSKSNTGTDRQAMGGNTDNAQNQSTENSNNENSSARFGNSNELESGERVLSDIERDLLSQLQELSTDPSVAQTTIRHGYDLYV